MKIKALRPLNGHYGQKQPGDVWDAPESLAKSLVERGLAAKVKGAPPHANKMAEPVENKASSGPLAGSPTGGAARPSSSAGVQVRNRSRSKKRVVALGSSS
jgi:hypothetical protein